MLEEKKMLPVAIGCDHGAYELKEQLRLHLEEKGIPYIDFGTFSPESVHYPIYADAVCKAIQRGECERGILLCSTGIGMSIAANKHRGIRAAVCSDTYSARFTRLHNDSNVLCLGALVVGRGLAFDIVDAFLSTEFEGGRHAVRVNMINELEKSWEKEPTDDAPACSREPS
ncbi:MAG TPA: ribose 5-phosphate isomerase B [Bacillota bacterium]|nr:ribose 5-phosphate isomerase B [Bacillota bacterium]